MKTMLITAVALALGAYAAQAQTVVTNKQTLVGQSKKYAIIDQNGNPVDATLCALSLPTPVVTVTKVTGYITLTGTSAGTAIGMRWTCTKPGFVGSPSSAQFTITVTNPPWEVTSIGDSEVP